MELQEFFIQNRKIALAYSGGVDSAYLLFAARAFGIDVKPYYVRTRFQPEFEYKDAMRLVKTLGMEAVVIDLNIFACPEVTANPPDRCYHCKQRIMQAIKDRAKADGYDVLVDGTNADDVFQERPGMKALDELGILSPLKLCGLGKEEIRHRSKNAGLFTWNKPSYSCLATRVASGEEITAEKLKAIEDSENCLFSLGFSDFRVRLREGKALLQFTEEQLQKAKDSFDTICSELQKNFDSVSLDPIAREKSK